MTKLACRYAVVQFMPYSQTGEFANIGVVLACPVTGYFGFLLQTRKYGRVTAFFDDLPRNVYLTAVQAIHGELDRIRMLIEGTSSRQRTEHVREVFDALVHPREAIIRFGAARAVLATSPEVELKRLFDDYVDHAFVTPEYAERTLTRQLTDLLGSLNLPEPFREERIGNDEIHARFPFVQRRGPVLHKVIKPFNLAQSEPNSIYDHGDSWVTKVKRLRARNLLPQDVLFAVAGPPETDVKRYLAFQEICSELTRLGVEPVDERSRDQIVQFALN